MTDMSLSQTLVFGHIWQSVAIAAVLAGALIIGKRMRGATRYGLGVAAFVASLALPLAAFIPGETIVAGLLKQLNAPVSIEAAAPATEVAVAPTLQVEAPATPVTPVTPVVVDGVELLPVSMASVPMVTARPALPVSAAVTEAPAQPASLITLPAISMPDIGLPLLAIWLGVAAFLLFRTGRDLLAVERLVARARPADLPPALKQRFADVRVVVSPDAPGPMAAGLFRPSIVLPEAIALASPGMAALLEHEHAHIRRRDMLAALGQRVALALLWWSPALYWISRRMDEEREVACDEAAVDCTGDAKAFARSLTKQAENQLWVRAPRLAVGAIGPRSQVGRRVRRLIDLAKSGGSPAKYSGRLAFAGLAIAVGAAAMITPRFTANAQQPNDAIDLTSPNAAELARQDQPPSDRLDGAAPGAGREFNFDFDFDASQFAALGADIEAMMAELGPELELMMADLGPEFQAEMAGLSADMAAMGVDIGAMVSQDVIARMPEIMEEVRKSLEEAGIDPDTIHDWDDFQRFDSEEFRAAMQEAREEMKHALGPELQAEIRAAMDEARREIAEHKDEIAAAMRERQEGLAIAKEALAAARAEIQAARARGDFKAIGPDGIKFDFDFDKDVLEHLRAAGISLDDAALDGGKGIRIAMMPNAKAHALIDAADDCDIEALNKLVQEKVDVNSLVPGMGTALMAAADVNCDAAARILINAGADVNRGFPGQGTPLSIAASNSALPVVQLLLNRGADVDASQPGQDTPLVEAIREGDLTIVKALVEKGADINRKTPASGNRSPLDQAERHGEDEIAAYLRSKGAASARATTH